MPLASPLLATRTDYECTTLFHRFERYCFGWDAQYDRVLLALLGMGIDGVYSDHVDRMMAAVEHSQR